MKKQHQIQLIITLLVSVLPLNAQIPDFSRIDTSIICTIGGNSETSAWGDFNNDGLEDLIILNNSAEPGTVQHFLFENLGNWNFRRMVSGAVADHSSAWGAHGANWADYDNDGLLDLFINNCKSDENSSLWENNALFHNQGDGLFIAIEEGSIVNDGGDSGPAAWLDIDNDGFIDLYVANQFKEGNFLYHNNGNGTFSRFNGDPVANFTKSLDLGPYPADIDNDRDADLFGVAFIYNVGAGTNYLFTNDGHGNFTEVNSGPVASDETYSFNAAWGDYDNDGDLDLYVPTYDLDYDILYQNDGAGNFTQIDDTPPLSNPRSTDGIAWADFDNDGYLDLFFSELGATNNEFYRNMGDGTFTLETIESVAIDTGGFIAINDMNNDGFPDILLTRGYQGWGPSSNILYANEGNENGWLKVKLVGSVSNAAGIGARIRAKATIDGNSFWQMRDIGLTQHSLYALFGAGDATQFDSIIVEWPAGHDTVLLNVDVNQQITITETIPAGYLKASFSVSTTKGTSPLSVEFNDISRFDPNEPIISWAWDFDNDGTVDSDAADPTYVYQSNNDTVLAVSFTVTNSSGSSQIIRKKLIVISGESEPELNGQETDASDISLFPNPVNSELHITFPSIPSKGSSIKLMDISGKVIYSTIQENEVAEFTLDMIGYMAGVYFISIQNEEFSITQKLIKNY